MIALPHRPPKRRLWHKALIVVIVAAAPLAGANQLSRNAINNAMSSWQHMVAGSRTETLLAQDMRGDVLDCRRFEKDFLLNLSSPAERSASRESWEKTFRHARQRIDALRVSSPSDAAANAWTKALDEYGVAFRGVAEEVQQGRIDNTAEANDRIRPHETALQVLTEQTDVIAKITLDRAIREAQSTISRTSSQGRRTVAWALLATAASLGVCVLAAWNLGRRARALTALCERVRSGERPDGHTLRGEDELTSLADAIVATGCEMADRQSALMTQRDKLAQLALIAQKTTNAVIVTDVRGRLVWANEGFTRISGYTLEESLGRVPGEFLQYDKSQPEAIRVMHDATVAGKGCRVEILNRAKDGREYTLEINIEPLHDDHGVLTGFMAIESDVTERVAAAAELAARESRLRAIFEAEPECVKLVDREYRLMDMNPAGLASIGASSIGCVRGVDTLRLIAPECREAYRQSIDRAFAGDSTITEMEIVGLDGRRRWMEQHAVGLRSQASESGLDHIVEVLAVSRDITLRKQMERDMNAAREAAESATRTKSEFLANMSHEIRTPMTAILGYTDLLAEEGHRAGSKLCRERSEYIDTIKRNGEHLLTIINDILDLSKIEAGKMTVERIETSPEQILLDVDSLMQVKAKGKGVPLRIVRRTALPATIQSDPVRLRQILMNLVGNALKFTEIGEVTVQVGLENSHSECPLLRFDITDTGIGMTAEQTRGLFAAFVQADTSTTRKFGGTGLGLRISKSLTQLLGGDITVTSEPGRGSTFSVTVQTGSLAGVTLLAPQEAGGVVRSGDTGQASVSAGEPLRGVRIFFAEDGPDNQRLIAFHLRKAGADVRIFNNGKVACEALTEDGTLDGSLVDPPPCDVVLTDMQMPELDGYELARRLRAKGWKGLILALTAHAMRGDDERCLAAGCDRYASKPIEKHKLIAACSPSTPRETREIKMAA